METKQKYLVHFTFSKCFKSSPNSLQNLKSLSVRVLEIMRGGGGGGGAGEGLAQPTLSIRCGYQTSQYEKG